MTHNPVFHHGLLSGKFFATSNTLHPDSHPTLSTLSTQHFHHSDLHHFIICAVIRLVTSELLLGIIDICCHSVEPSCMVVLRILLWLTCYDLYYQQGIEQHFSGNPLLQTFKTSPSIKPLLLSTPFVELPDPAPEISDEFLGL